MRGIPFPRCKGSEDHPERQAHRICRTCIQREDARSLCSRGYRSPGGADRHGDGIGDVGRVSNGKMRGVCVVGGISFLGCRDNVGESLYVVLCKTVRGGLCGSSLQVVKILVLLLIVGKLFSHVVENLLSELLSLGMSEVLLYPGCIEASLVHTNETDGREVVCKGSEISLCVGIESLVKKLGYNGTLGRGSHGQVHRTGRSRCSWQYPPRSTRHAAQAFCRCPPPDRDPRWKRAGSTHRRPD